MPGGTANRSNAAIDGPDERTRLPDDAAAALPGRPWLRRPLLWMAAARQVEPSSASRIARALAERDQPALAERLVRAALIPFPADASLRRDRLRLLDRLGRRADLLAYAAQLAGDAALHGETGFLLWSLFGGEAMPARFDPAGSAPALDVARFARCRGDAAAALAGYRRALAAVGDADADGRAILREAARAVLQDDAWPQGLDLVERAAGGGLVSPGDRTLAAARLIAGRNPHPLAALPALAFEDLRHTPARPKRKDGPILMVANGLACGGMERVLAATVAGLRRRGRDVRLALSDFEAGDPARSFFLADSGLDPATILRLDQAAAPAGATAALPRRWRREAAALAAIVAETKPAVVHAWNDRLGLLAGVAVLPAGAPRLLIHLHHMRPTRDPAEAAAARDYPACLRLLAGRPDVSLAFCADAARRDYAHWLGIETPRFHTILNGFPAIAPITRGERTAARRRFRLPTDAPVVASLFRFEAVKQPLAWLDAAAAIARAVPGTRFLMPGDGELLAATRARAAALGLEIRFPGRIADTRSALAAADLLMMSSASEGLPNGAVEAQLAGVPVVGFDVGGMAETMRPGVTGRLVAANDIAALAAAAIDWIGDPLARAGAGLAARAFAHESFAMDRYMDAIEALYEGAA